MAVLVAWSSNILTCLLCVDRMQRKVLHQFVMMAKRQMPTRIGDHVDAEDKAAHEGRYHHRFYRWLQKIFVPLRSVEGILVEIPPPFCEIPVKLCTFL